MSNPSLKQLIAAARLLQPLLEELVFIGGAVTGLLLTDEAAGDPRPTLDVDAIADITSYARYAAFGGKLRALGFSEDTTKGAPTCRWVHQATILDVMPLDERILGFSNRWYREAMQSATRRLLADHLEIRLVTAPSSSPPSLKHSEIAGRATSLAVRTLKTLFLSSMAGTN